MKFIVTLFIIFLFPQAFAHEGEVQSTETRILQQFETDLGQRVYLLAREDGHLLGQPYQVELKVACEKSSHKLEELPVKDSFSVCDMDPGSLKINKRKTAIAMKVKLADIDSYYQEIERGVASPEVRCAKPTKIKKFSLANLCP